MSYILFSLLVLSCFLSSANGKPEGTYHTRIALRNNGENNISLAGCAVAIRGDEDSRRLSPISSSVIQPNSTYFICYYEHPNPCDAYWSGARYYDDDTIQLSINDVVIASVKLSGRANANPSADKDGLVLDEAFSAKVADLGKKRQPYDTSNQAARFDDSCWSIRSRLRSFPFDSCSRPISRETVTIGTFNALFLFDGVDDRIDIWGSPSAAGDHLRRIAAVIRRHRPDILHLVEVENLDMVRRLIAAIEQPAYTPSFVQGRDTYTGQDVALISRGEWVRSLTRTNCRSGEVPGSSCGASLDGTVGVSKNLVALFDSCLFGFKFAMVGVHFYAHPTTRRPCIRRESQARVIQDVVVNLIDAGFEVMVMGDVNDYSDRYEDVYTREGPRSRVLSMLRDPDGDGVDELDNVMRLLPRRQRYTAWWDRDSDDEYPGVSEATAIDHILMTRRLFDLIQSVWIDHEMDPETVSDHWPMFVRMRTRGPVDRGAPAT